MNFINLDASKQQVIRTAVLMLNMGSTTKELESKKTEEFREELRALRDRLTPEQKELTFIDSITEETFVRGLTQEEEELYEMKLGTSKRVRAYKALGFTLEGVDFDKLVDITQCIQESIGSLITDIYRKVMDAVANEDWESDVLTLFRFGIEQATSPFMTFNTFLNSIGFELTDDVDMVKIQVSYAEQYEEWKEAEIDKAFDSLVVRPTSGVMIFPKGVSELLATFKSKSENLYNTVTMGGEALTPEEFMGVELAERVRVNCSKEEYSFMTQELIKFIDLNKMGTLNTQNGPIPIPSSISIADVLIAILIKTSDELKELSVIPGMTATDAVEHINKVNSHFMVALNSLEEIVKPYSSDASRTVAHNLMGAISTIIPSFCIDNVIMRYTQAEYATLNAQLTTTLFTNEELGLVVSEDK